MDAEEIFFIENTLGCEMLAAGRIPSFSPGKKAKTLVVCDDPAAQALLRKKGIPFKTNSDYLDAEDFREIKKTSIQMADKWYRYRDFTRYGQMHLGSLFSMDFADFEKVIAYVEKVLRVVEKERPRALKIHAGGGKGELAAEILRARGLGDIEVGTFGGRSSSARRLFSLEKLAGNPYYQYLKKPRKLKTTLKEIRDYFNFFLPTEFKKKGKGFSAGLPDKFILITVKLRNEAFILANVMRELEKRGHRLVPLVTDEDAGAVLEYLEKSGSERHIRPGDLFNERYRGLYLDIRRKMTKKWQETAADPAFWTHLTYRGIAVLKYMNRAKLKWFVTKLSPFWAVVHDMITGLDGSCRAVITVNDVVTLGRVAAFASEEMSVPSLEVQHGDYIAVPARAVATKWCVWSEAHKQRFVQNGIQEDRLTVTGNPAYDCLVSSRLDMGEAREKLGIAPQYRHVITWAPTALWEHNRRTFLVLGELGRRHPHIMFIFKPHPAEPLKWFRKTLEHSFPVPNLQIADANRRAGDYFCASDIVMSWNSNVITEAAVLDKSIIGLNLEGFPEDLPCVSAGIAVGARTPEELEQAVNGILSGNSGIALQLKKARWAYIEKNIFRNDGGASARIAGVLEDLMRQYNT